MSVNPRNSSQDCVGCVCGGGEEGRRAGADGGRGTGRREGWGGGGGVEKGGGKIEEK